MRNINISPRERKCVRYLTNEMSKAERSVFEIELSLDYDLLALFENYQKIWASYPNNKLQKEGVSFAQVLKRQDTAQKISFRKKKLKVRNILSITFLVLFCGVLYFIQTTNKPYTYHKTAAKGERLTFVLPDSSTVILNSGSTVKYANNFNSKRSIWLTGEAYFKVIKKNNLPFVVHTNDFDVRVLGTQFNINSTAVNQTISLAKGKVNVLFKESRDQINLIPNEELVWNTKTKAIIKRTFDGNAILAWKDNILILDNIMIQDALSKINKFYGVHFIVKDPELAKKHIKGTFKNQSIDEFITSLEFILDVNILQTSPDNIEITK